MRAPTQPATRAKTGARRLNLDLQALSSPRYRKTATTTRQLSYDARGNIRGDVRGATAMSDTSATSTQQGELCVVSPELLRIRGWLQKEGFQNVLLAETKPLSVQSDSSEDYVVKTELRLVPDQPWCLSADIWITTDGHVGIGIGTYDAVASWLGFKAIRHGFVGGFEPAPIDGNQVIALLQLCSTGFLRVKWLAATGLLLNAKLSIDSSCLDGNSNLPDVDMLRRAKIDISRSRSRELKTKPWR